MSDFSGSFSGSISAPSFTPTGSAYMTVNASTSTSAVLGSNSGSTPPAILALITNLSNSDAFLAFGDSSVTATKDVGITVLARQARLVPIGSATYVAAIVATGGTGLNSMVETGY